MRNTSTDRTVFTEHRLITSRSLTTGKEYTDPSMAGLDERKKKEEKSK